MIFYGESDESGPPAMDPGALIFFVSFVLVCGVTLLQARAAILASDTRDHNWMALSDTLNT